MAPDALVDESISKYLVKSGSVNAQLLNADISLISGDSATNFGNVDAVTGSKS